jgi:carbon-monoxide dehydrogenase medium subunit
MRSFDFFAPRDVNEACDALAQHGPEALPMAGGQTLLLQMKPRLICPSMVIHIGRLESLRGWTYDHGRLELGAATPYAALEDASPLVGAHELLRDVAGNLADRAVRNLGTIGGSISAAVASYDVPIALLALDAELVLRSSFEERTLTVDEFVQGSGVTARGPDELLEKVTLPAREGWRWSFHKFRRRLADPATAAVAVLARVGEGGTVDDSRVVVGALTDRPRRLRAVETALRGFVVASDPTADVAVLAADETTGLLGSSVPCSAAYAHQLVRTLTTRALRSVADDSRWRA